MAAIQVILLIAVTSAVALGGTGTLYRSGSVYCDSGSCDYKDNVLDKKATAYGTFNNTLMINGWGVLDIVAGQGDSPFQTNRDIMFAAGFLEGVFTAEQMEYHFANLHASFHPSNSTEAKLRDWFTQQQNWTNMMIREYPKDPIWRHAAYINDQLDGLYAGYRSVRHGVPNALERYAFQFLNAVGDLLDLMSALEPSSIPDWTKFTPDEAARYFYTNGHCSALIKLLPGYENIFMSHSSWFTYSSTNRIYKYYNLNVDDPATSAKKLSFSSYPGFLESLDDFYLLSSGMVMLQTTNNIYNKTLYKLVKPQSLMAWQRVRIANMMANSGKEWAETVAMYNSGTYNNQYMVIDLKLVELGRPIPDNTLWVTEQIPGLVVADDLTQILRAGYFPSYNVPFFEEIYNKSGYLDYAKHHGLDYTYQLAPRAKIFRRDQSTVKDMDSMKAIMRYNDYKRDPYSGNSPWGAICSRGDLDPKKPLADGCYDTKVADFHLAKEFQAEVINGPTLGADLPVFSWDGPQGNTPHKGLPTTYNFPFVRMYPRL